MAKQSGHSRISGQAVGSGTKKVIPWEIELTSPKEGDVYPPGNVLLRVELKSEVPEEGNLEDLISAADWDVLFPHRYGTVGGELPSPEDDFFSYANFLEAYRLMADIKVKFERRCATNYYRITWHNKETNESRIIRNDPPFDNSNSAIIVQEVDYANFANEGDLETRKRELMAFLANISQETTGGWDTAPGGRYAWGLHFRQEVGYDEDSLAYRDESHELYPPAPGKSYHGRGPIQLSWNYNYGQASEFLYGHKDVLLEQPGKLLENGAFSFQTGIWFWMTPQYPKPSCHEVMVPLWTPTPEDEARGLKQGFGATVNIINGGIECGGPTEFEKVVHRISHYQRYTEIAGVSMELDGGNVPENCGCALMGDFRIDSQECGSISSLQFSAPITYGAAGVTNNNPAIRITLMKSDPNNEIVEVTIAVDGTVFDGEDVQWTPSGYRKFTAVAIGNREGKDPVTATVEFAVYHKQTLAGCEFIPEWDPNKVYQDRGYSVRFNGKVYENKWYADGSTIPGADIGEAHQPWDELGACNSQ